MWERAILLRADARFRVESCGRDEPKGAAPVVAATRVDEDTLRVELREPTEPLAWAIDATPAADKPFQITWHAERRPGSRAVAAASVAELASRSDSVAVRVFEDDGTVRETTAVVRAPKGKARRRESVPPTLRSRA